MMGETEGRKACMADVLAEAAKRVEAVDNNFWKNIVLIKEKGRKKLERSIAPLGLDGLPL